MYYRGGVMWRNGIEISAIQTLRMKRPTFSRPEQYTFFIYSLLTFSTRNIYE